MPVQYLNQLVEITQSYRPRKKWYRRVVKRSAVAIIVREAELGLEALMIKRADREGDPWSGHMAFPGGLSDHSDHNNLQTARRETLEEIGLDTNQYTQCMGRLSDVMVQRHRGKKPMIVTPYVFTIEDVPELTLNHEVADILWVPLGFFADHANRQTMQWKLKKINFTLPCYFYQQQRIWGLSLMMMDELIAALKATAGDR